MNRTIEEVRKAKGFTQEQVAKGVGKFWGVTIRDGCDGIFATM